MSETLEADARPASREALASDHEIAERLADESFAVVRGYLPPEQWGALASEARALHARGAFRAAGIGRGPSFRLAPEVRDDRVHWIDPQAPSRRQAAWLQRMERLRGTLNRQLYLGLSGFEAHLARYAPGARYRTHLDRFADASHRRVSVLLYLNEQWQADEGGELRLYLDEPDRAPSRDVAPEGGTLVAFLSDAVHHEVLPAARERWSLAGWFTARG